MAFRCRALVVRRHYEHYDYDCVIIRIIRVCFIHTSIIVSQIFYATRFRRKRRRSLVEYGTREKPHRDYADAKTARVER